MRRRIGLVLAGSLLAGVTTVLGSPAPAHADPPPETVAELTERLRQDPVQVNTLMGVGDTAAVDAALTELAGAAEPWVSTGFGAVEPDLPARLADRA